jgi:secondary thiamine-phosphate synthase enzyme
MEFEVKTNKSIEVIDITGQVEERIKDGKACIVFTPHATAAIILNEFEPNIKSDYEEFFSKVAKGNWKHNAIDNNAEAHLLSALISPSIVIPVEKGKLVLGTWQSIMLVELDGPRTRKIIVRTI